MSVTDDEFVRAFEGCELTGDCFHHRDHIRLAWIYFHKYGEAEATERIVQGIRRFAAHLGVSEKYHHTITIAWMRLVAGAARASTGSFDDFALQFPALFDKSALGVFYSASVLHSDLARAAFIEPDLKPLPPIAVR